jgi:hypothetical protein
MYVIACGVCGGGLEPFVIALLCSLPVIGGFIKLWYNRLKRGRCNERFKENSSK